MKKILKISVYSLTLVLLVAASCLMFSGCSNSNVKRIDWVGTVPDIESSTLDAEGNVTKEGTSLADALSSVTVYYYDIDGTTILDQATGYTELKEKGAYITWSGTSPNAVKEEDKGEKPGISITWNQQTLVINYSFYAETKK